MEGEFKRAVFKPPYATSEERKTVTLEEGELMFDSTEKAFYTGDGTPGGRAIHGSTVTISGYEELPGGSAPCFEETEASTPQAREYTFRCPRIPDSIRIPSDLLSDDDVALPEAGKVVPFLRSGNDSIEFAVKKEDGSVVLVSGGAGNAAGSGMVVPAVCTEVNGSLCMARPVSIASDGTASWAGDAEEALLPAWDVPSEE